MALGSYLVHGGNHLLRGEPHDLMWFCNIAPLVLAIGCYFRKALLVTVPLLWLLYGTPMWALDLFTGAGVILTSFLPHVLCVAVGLLAARKLGWPKHSWLWAFGGSLLILALTRLLTPAAYNVNMVFSVWAGWEPYFPRHDVYLALLVAGSVLLYFVVESSWLRFTANPPTEVFPTGVSPTVASPTDAPRTVSLSEVPPPTEAKP